MRLRAAWLGVFTLLVSGVAWSASDVDAAYQRLDDFAHSLQSLQTNFTQVLNDDHGRTLEKSKGTLSIQRPGHFRWNYLEPHPQEIVSDGAKVWVYDKDLEQVTVRPLDTTLAGTPAVLLSGNGSLKDSFTVSDVQQKGSELALTLTPQRGDTDFKHVRLIFDGSALKNLQLADKLGQLTTLEFTDFKRNPKFDAALFNFKPPAGADVIGDTDAPPVKK
jgi:outer membrane lipoprotein carrier protein